MENQFNLILYAGNEIIPAWQKSFSIQTPLNVAVEDIRADYRKWCESYPQWKKEEIRIIVKYPLIVYVGPK